MTVEAWLRAAVSDAEGRGLPHLTPLLEGLAPALARLRAAGFHPDAAPRGEPGPLDAGPALAPGPSAPWTPPQLARTSHLPPQSVPPGIAQFATRLRARTISSVEATEACLQAIAARDPALNAFIHVTADRALAEARQADAELAAGHDRGPLHGVPVSVKDLVDVRGVATTGGSRVRAADRAPADAAAIVHLRHAGAVLIGKTNLHEFAFGTTNEDSGFGAAHHPRDPGRSPGGSSGGSAISVAAGMALGTVGTDTGGSIRIPSAACGLVGLKPTVGEISTDGVVPLSHTLDHLGPLALTVADAWLLFQALVGRPTPRPLTPAPLAGLRVGVPTRYFCDVLQPSVRTAFENVLALLERAGARLAPVTIAHADDIAAVYLGIVLPEAAAYHSATLESVPERYTAAVRSRLEMARYVLGEDYLRALAGRAALRRAVDAALTWHDILLLPTMPIVAPPLGVATVAIEGTDHPVRNLMLRLTQLFNLTGHPAVSMPCGADADGLPIGLQVVGRRHETDVLMHVCLGIEAQLHAGA